MQQTCHMGPSWCLLPVGLERALAVELQSPAYNGNTDGVLGYSLVNSSTVIHCI